MDVGLRIAIKRPVHVILSVRILYQWLRHTK